MIKKKFSVISPIWGKRVIILMVMVALLITGFVPSINLNISLAQTFKGEALVFVNSASARYTDFRIYIQPYLDNFGIPYKVLDIASEPVGSEIGEYSVIIVGHQQLDPTLAYLDPTEEANISSAVKGGTGFVNFDNDLSVGGSTPRYQFVQDIFGFGYINPSAGSGVRFIDPNQNADIIINCWEDFHQSPVLPTTTNSSDLITTDGKWTEFKHSRRPYPGVFAGVDEENYGLPVMRFFRSGIKNGEYEIRAKFYTANTGRNMRYYYGYTPDNPKAFYVDTVGGSGGSEQFTEYNLGKIIITDGSLNLYVVDADLLPGTDSYPFFGWATIHLVPVDIPSSTSRFITKNHQLGETINTGTMMMAGITLPSDVTPLAMSGDQPFLAVTTTGKGQAVQWGTYDWVSLSVKGPIYGLDDLVWRSIVWAARKPIVMQGLPNFVTIRVDDGAGPFGWVNVANEFGFKPWIGLFLDNINDAEATYLSSMVVDGRATTSIHAFSAGNFFYYNHYSGGNWSDGVMSSYYNQGTQWHITHNVPISKFVLPHYYEFGTNAFSGLRDWGVEFVGTVVDPGTFYGSSWIVGAPYRLYEPRQSSRYGGPLNYADFVTVPGHPEFEGQFFNCVTEIRDDAGYEWYPDNDVSGSIGRGTRQIKRALDSMVLATLFTHEFYISQINSDNWRAILQGIVNNLAPYKPIFVTMEDACQYLRAMYTTDISASTYDSVSRQIKTTVVGGSDIKTQFHLFTGEDDSIMTALVDVPSFSGSTTVTYQLPGSLDHIIITPNSAKVATRATQQFMATGYDANGNPISNMAFTWSALAGGTIDQNGLFTAGTTPGVYINTIIASNNGILGYASVEVNSPTLSRLGIDPITGGITAGTPFAVRITAYDQFGNVMTSFTGQAALSDTTGTITPTMTGSFVNGVWSGNVTIAQASNGVTITARSGSTTGTSNVFNVLPPSPVEITINCWEDNHQFPVLQTTTNSADLSTTDGKWTEFKYSARPFPAVFAGADEENLGLPVMRFYTSGVQNGTYNVVANLYSWGSGRTMRYYFGYQSSAPKASHIDVIGSNADANQFKEVNLGTVTITDGTFNIYVLDADLLEGSYPYFGWAWIRLVPIQN